MLLRDVYENEYAVLKAHNDACRHQYRNTLGRWAQILGHDPAITDLDDLVVQTYLQNRKANVSAASARKDRNQLSALWTYCAKRRYVERFPTLAQIRAPGRVPRGYTIEDVSAILRESMRPRPPLKATPVPPHLFWSSLTRSCWETAERIGSHLALRWRDVDTAQRFVVFPAEGRKNATRDILRPLSEEQCRWLESRRGRDAEFVWPWVTTKPALWHHFDKICKAAGVTNRGFHGFRKSAASYLSLAGGDATQLLDHSNPAITKNHYIDVTIAKPKHSTIDLLPPLDLVERPPPEKPAVEPKVGQT